MRHQLHWIRIAFSAMLGLVMTWSVAGAADGGPMRPSGTAAEDARLQSTPDPGLPRLMIRPADSDAPYFAIALEPGGSAQLRVALANLGEHPVEARTYAADAYSLTNGGFGVRTASDPQSGVTTWLDYPADVLELRPGETVMRTVTVLVPRDTQPGEYVSALVIENTKPVAVGTQGSGITFQQILRQAIAVAITVPGPVNPGVEFSDAHYTAEGSLAHLTIAVRNTGNVHLRLRGTISVQTGGGETIEAIPVQLDTIYASTATSIDVPLTTALAPGDYHAQVALQDEKLGFAAATDQTLPFVVASSAADAPSPLAVQVISIEPIRDATSGTLLFVNCTLQLANAGPPITNARVVLEVSHDGQPVEEVELGSSLTLPTGNADFQGRYLPVTGWQSGTYAFTVRVEGSPNPGQPISILLNQPAPSTVRIDESNGRNTASTPLYDA